MSSSEDTFFYKSTASPGEENCAPSPRQSFSYSHEAEFMQKLIKDTKGSTSTLADPNPNHNANRNPNQP